MTSYVAAAAGFLLCIALALGAFVVLKQERAQKRQQELSAQMLYESGQASAAKREKRCIKTPWDKSLKEAGIDTSPVVFAIQFVGITVVGAVFSWLLSREVVVGAVCAAALVAAMLLWVSQKRRKRLELFTAQFASVLPQLAASMKGSSTLERAIRLSTEYAEEPLRSGFLDVLADVSYGMPIYRALEGLAERSASSDVHALAAAVRIQERFGGSMVPVIESVGAHADARLKAQREIKTELAGTKLAKWFVAGSMPAIFLMMFLTNSQFKTFYCTQPLGWLVLGVSAAIEVLGLWLCSRITRCKGEVR